MIRFKEIAEKCIECPLCQQECAFLAKYGNPKEIAERIDLNRDATLTLAFSCSLCGLCGAVCPVNLDPRTLFLDIRREAVKKGIAPFPEHKGLLDYERRGISRRYTYYALPEGCDTIFFPGCTLPGTRPQRTIQVYKYLKKHIPNLGVVLDCCTNPSHDLGRQEVFEAFFGEMKDYFLNQGIQTVVTACPNCYKIFDEYGEGLTVKIVYEFLDGHAPPRKNQSQGSITIHDPCAVRFEESLHSVIRDLVRKEGLAVEEMPHTGKKTFCCGEGGGVPYISPDLAKTWRNKRREESGDSRMLTYCAGCVNFLHSRNTPAYHLLDFYFDPEATLAGKVKLSRSPITYLNRLSLKKYLRKSLKTKISRERT